MVFHDMICNSMTSKGIWFCRGISGCFSHYNRLMVLTELMVKLCDWTANKRCRLWISVGLTSLRFIKPVDGLLRRFFRVFQVWKIYKNISEDFELDTCVCV